MTFSASAKVQTRQSPPPYFDQVCREATELWRKLDEDPVLAGPWRQLFSQVQSPRHVLSELLQNADDAGATEASASLHDGSFCFRHSGSDFTHQQFISLCRFGFSNKRNLHTIGFRGIGFKSTFSLGPDVTVLTPSLAVRFNQTRFTKPEWIADGEPSSDTQIRVGLQDEHREAELRKNLKDWTESPTSLLFFSNIRSLEIDGQRIERKTIDKGPIPRSEWVELSTIPNNPLLVVWSEYEDFPEEAVAEIRKERFSEEVELPPCRVELVLGLPFTQRLFVVLPTGVKPNVPFCCNAPFVQDPARLGIKEPSVSPTNRWLLDRLGALAAESMSTWLGNATIPLSERAKAYELLPEVSEERDDTDSVVTEIICSSMDDSLSESPVLLTENGEVLPAKECFAPPRPLYRVWTATQLLEAFGGTQSDLLSHAVTDPHRIRLSEWGWLDRTSGQDILHALEGGTRPSRPDSWPAVAELWQFISRHVRYDHGGKTRRRLAIIPVLNSDDLAPANDVVRVSDTRRGVRTDDWRFIIDGLCQLHPDWIEAVQSASETDALFGGLGDMLGELGLADPTPIDRVIRHRAETFFDSEELDREECVRFAHLLAALDATSPECFEFVTRDNVRRTSDDSLFVDDGALEQLVPPAWADERFLHEDYEAEFVHCARDQWSSWSRSTKSGLSTGSFFETNSQTPWNWTKRDAEQFLESRGVGRPSTYHYRTPSFQITDHDFDRRLRPFWEKLALNDQTIWARVLERILLAPPHERAKVLYAELHECWGAYTRRVQCGTIPAKWLVSLRGLVCIPDTHGKLREPAQLLLRSPDTEPLLGAEAFVSAELDTPANRELLLLLGARATPAGADSILNRIRALSEAETPPLTELGKWYDALDRVLGRRRPDDLELIREAFSDQSLIFTEQGEWACLGEVFQRLYEDDPPGLPTVHPEFRQLSIWSVIGVSERPSPDLLVDYVDGFDSGQKLDGNQLKRVRAVLREQPSRIWNECGHWLALDGNWRPVSDLELVLFDDAAVRVRELFAPIKSATADCRSLRSEARHHECFAELRDLAASLTYRPAESQGDMPPAEQRQWLRETGEFFSRLHNDDETLRDQIRASGGRLAETAWQSFQLLSVLPYLDGSPAGQAHEPVVLWDERTLYVKEGSAARVCDAVVAELSRCFPSEAVQRALRSCYERDAAFIADYLAEHFEFDDVLDPKTPEADTDQSGEEKPEAPREPTSEAPQQPNQSPEVSDPNASSTDADPTDQAADEPDSSPGDSTVDEPVNIDDAGEQGEEEPPDPDEADPQPEPTRKPPTPRQGPLIARFAKSKGFRPTGVKNEWAHQDGSRLEHTSDIFPWVHKDGDRVIQRFWIAEQSLTRSGIDLGSDVWEMLRKHPEHCSFVLSEDERPLVLPGTTLLRMVQGESLELFASRYRLRRPE